MKQLLSIFSNRPAYIVDSCLVGNRSEMIVEQRRILIAVHSLYPCVLRIIITVEKKNPEALISQYLQGSFPLEPSTGIEPVTSSLPWKRSTY